MAAELSGPAEVPPNASTARGAAAITVDTASRILTWRVEYSGLSGPVSAAHFHGPASQTANAGILVNIVVPVPPGPLAGSVTLTEAAVADLVAGRWYVNLHTAGSPAGEIRGQVLRK
jgi:hypothetical protein